MTENSEQTLADDRTLTLNRLVEFVQRRGHVTFVEIMEAFDGTRGDRCVELQPNLLLWTGTSVALGQLIASPEFRRRIEIRPTIILTYAIDGQILQLPLAKRVRPYKKPHWLPVVMHPVAHPVPHTA